MPVSGNPRVRSLEKEEMVVSEERGKIQTWGEMRGTDIDRGLKWHESQQIRKFTYLKRKSSCSRDPWAVEETNEIVYF